MPESAAFLTCAHCGDRIGVYEHAWLEQADGILRASSFLNLGREGAGGRLFHLGCLAPETIDGRGVANTRSAETEGLEP